MQELDIPFKCISASEPNENFRQFAMANHGDKIDHFHAKMEDQLRGLQCQLHAKTKTASCKIPTNPHVMVLGTPCNPFSTQRRGRYQDVMEHHLTTHTFGDAYQMFATFQPVSAVMEQTEGFDLPLVKGHKETPYQRLAWG